MSTATPRQRVHPRPHFDPERWLAFHPEVEVISRPLGGPLGRTDGCRLIEVERQLLGRERRCVLTHEILHIEHGHRDGCSPREEARVRQETAALLVPTRLLAQVLGECRSVHEAALECDVSVDVLLDAAAELARRQIAAA